MKLLLKLPKNKPPFIGVQFENEFTAGSLNQMWPNSYPNDLYKIILEPGEQLDLTLVSGIGMESKYLLEYDPVELLRFLDSTRHATRYNFGHVIRKIDTHVLVRTNVNKVKWLLKVISVTLKHEY